MLYLQENLRQQTLVGIFEASQATISRAINSILNVLDMVLPLHHNLRIFTLNGYAC